MATQITSKIREDIDWYLGVFEREARWAVDLVTRWDDIDLLEQEDLVAEWPLMIDYLLRSLAYREKSLMTSEQCHHLQNVRAFLAEHESALARVLGEENLMLNPPTEAYASL